MSSQVSCSHFVDGTSETRRSCENEGLLLPWLFIYEGRSRRLIRDPDEDGSGDGDEMKMNSIRQEEAKKT